ncbi:tetratricopeptide repeat domain-containing protein [Clohesyomyces aquaticus]|uniref:Tetratricopeptide repeat domain-containing protein n=1 Tax=Clohesyomyces aquaticus TaxID=1231657 RepID=A0A1Y1YUL9_9PLEO|nr:tetratricopeptide repeat domain-containing protein [Clohesyomyces aquaticus]
MADPFSIVASTASIVDICVRLVCYLKDVQKGVATIQADITSLVHEVEALEAISTSILQIFNGTPFATPEHGQHDLQEGLWNKVKRTLEDSEDLVAKLETIVKDIYGKNGQTVSGSRDALGKSHRRRSKESELRQCRDQLATFQNVLQILLAFINLHSTKGSQEANARSFEILKKDLSHIGQQLGAQIEKLQNSNDSRPDQPAPHIGTIKALSQLSQSIEYAASTIKLVSSNKYFDTPQLVSSIFTGREDELENLKRFFITPSVNHGRHQQVRFVIQGIGGSGKSQFCSKFADDNREHFWGVFWIDASTTERIKHTYARICRFPNIEPNTEEAAMHWLSHLDERWLLIIDNADDPKITLERHFPKGNRGHILVTTRKPAHRFYGNVGPGFFQFDGLDFREADNLLLKAAQVPTPWDALSETLASKITKTLGCLVLAIVHAGAVIRDGMCTLTTFENFYKSIWDRIRSTRHGMDDPEHHMQVYTTWELCYQRIESKGEEGDQSAQDAIQLLATFSFMHWKHIRYDIFRRAVECPLIEESHERKVAIEEKERLQLHPESLKQRVDRFKMAAVMFLFKNRGPLPLPNILRDARKSGSIDDFDIRMLYALKELTQMALVTYNKLNDSYSMHPIVHMWARVRPGMRLAEQAIWAEATASILASSLLIPPLSHGEKDDEYIREVLPHIQQVCEYRDDVNDRITKKLQSRWISSFAPSPNTMNPARGLMYAKFSLVYAHNGYWGRAERLLSDVRDYLTKILGPGHERTRRVTLALAGTYFNLGGTKTTEELQRSVLQSCLTSLGPDHVDTLRVKDTLGQTMWHGGRYTEARYLHQEAYDGLSKELGSQHEDALSALDNLARTIGRFYEREDILQAQALHLQAIEGMKKVHGEDHPRTLFAKENLVRIYVFLGGELRETAEQLITYVVEKRKKLLGKEHAYTLLAMANATIVKISLGKLEEAEEIGLEALPIAERNFGEHHVGTLFGYYTLGYLRNEQKRYTEAEGILVQVTERQKKSLSHTAENHPDRLGALIELAKCYRLRGKISESIRVCEEALKGFATISVKEHPFARDMKRAKSRMVEHQRRVARGEPGEPGITEPSRGLYGQFSVFF